MSKGRILSGMRPTGKLHLGNLLGALENWKALQSEGYECFYFVADWHALTTDYMDTRHIRSNIVDMVTDWLASGLDPEKSVLFIQSLVPEHTELHLMLSMITPVSWLERNPTYKEQMQELSNKDISTYGFLGYPVLQAADILIYKANYVPVGIDQAPHVELTREIARRFNYFYGEVFPIPDLKLTDFPKVLGTDGRKMSKSYQNAIYLADSPEEVRKKVSIMVTDPQRVRRTDPGNPEVCPVFSLHKIFTSVETQKILDRDCRTAQIGCVDCKKILAGNLITTLSPVYEKRQTLSQKPDVVMDILTKGSEKARQMARKTLEEAKAAMKML
ncbi:MAG TPA: tryptophan--tRNA ligase [Candidatus Limnocylindrales bacterium]|nr:tryptophan--tRNA ligase [Candidatus Limnocylindrales bacterium]